MGFQAGINQANFLALLPLPLCGRERAIRSARQLLSARSLTSRRHLRLRFRSLRLKTCCGRNCKSLRSETCCCSHRRIRKIRNGTDRRRRPAVRQVQVCTRTRIVQDESRKNVKNKKKKKVKIQQKYTQRFFSPQQQ